MRYLRLLIVSFLFVVLVVFCVCNRSMVSLSFFPLPFVIETRLFLLLFVVFLLGLLFGKYLRLKQLLAKAIHSTPKTIPPEV